MVTVIDWLGKVAALAKITCDMSFVLVVFNETMHQKYMTILFLGQFRLFHGQPHSINLIKCLVIHGRGRKHDKDQYSQTG